MHGKHAVVKQQLESEMSTLMALWKARHKNSGCLNVQARTTDLEKKLAVKDREIATITLEMQMLQPR